MKSSYAVTVAARLIEQLSQGVAPWSIPWEPGRRYLPYNPISGRNYRGMNLVWLLAASQAVGYEDARWLTYRQAQSFGAQVRKGEKGATIQYWKWREERPLRDENGAPIHDEAGQPLQLITELEKPRVFSAVVFNADQIDGLPVAPDRPPLPEWERHEIAERMIANLGVPIHHRPGDRAAYHRIHDEITMPERGQFATADAYYATCLHECGHASGHADRLNRDIAHPFGSMEYAREELRAEIASMMLGEQLSIGHDPGQHVAYIDHWVQLLKSDPREIFRATADAERIVRFLTGLVPELHEEVMLQAETGTKVMDELQEPEAGDDEAARERIYIAVPFSEKEDAKAQGARWDKSERSWYIPAGTEIAPFARWPQRDLQAEIAVSQIDPIEEFGQALREAGFQLDTLPEMDGKLHRIPVEGDKGRARSGAYTGYLDGHPAGFIQNFRTGVSFNWKSMRRGGASTGESLTQLIAASQARKQQRAVQEAAIHQATVGLLHQHIHLAGPAQNDHPYLLRKGVDAHGALLDQTGPLMIAGGEETPQAWSGKGCVILPVSDADGALIGAQSIDRAGRKAFARGGKIQGGMFHIGQPVSTTDTIVIAEGYSTAATIHEVTGLPTVVAFHAGNLESVATALRKKHPEAKLIIAGDNDHVKETEVDAAGRPKKNVGRIAAERTAMSIGGFAVLPKFEPDDQGSDWNDLRQSEGVESFKRQWNAQILRSQLHQRSGAHSAPTQPATEYTEKDARQTQMRSQRGRRR